jgi:tetratricopeptide (TPR) repeat protein
VANGRICSLDDDTSTVLFQTNASQETMNSQLAGLRNQIGRMENALHSRVDLQVSPSTNDREENDRIFRNLQHCVRVAENFHSNASSYAETLYGGSVLGEPLSNDRRNSISEWIPEPMTVDEASSTIPSTRLGSEDYSTSFTSPSSFTTMPPDNHDSDSDIDKELAKKLQELGLSNFNRGEYAKAETFFRKVIHETGKDLSADDLQTSKTKLATSLCYQEKWTEAEKLVTSLGWTKAQNDVDPFHVLHALALTYLQKNNFNLAIKYCKQAVNGKRKILGKEDDSLFESIALLSCISDAKGDPAEAEGYRSLLPIHRIVNLDALNYMDRMLAFSEVKLVVGIDFVSHSYCYATEYLNAAWYLCVK